MREKTWMHANADRQMWRHLCRAYEVELKLIDTLLEVPPMPIYPTIVFDETGDEALDAFVHPEDAVYVFGKTHMNKIQDRIPCVLAVRIPTPKPVCLFGVQAAAIVLEHRRQQLDRYN